MNTWRELSPFRGIDLEDSWILGWRYDAETQRLEFNVEFSLWPGHPAYEPPSAEAWTCYKSGRLVFIGVGSLTGLEDQTSVRPTIGPDGTADYDFFSALNVNGSAYEVVGEFGDVRLTAAGVEVELGPHAPVA